jgi:hypothetical protein
MALLSKKEFGEKCGIPTKDLSNYIKRNKVILTDDRIDEDNAMNAAFLAKCLKKVKVKPVPQVDVTLPVIDVEAAAPREKKPKGGKAKDKYDERFDLDTEKKKAEIAKLDRERQIAEVKHEKMLGKLIPTEVTKSLFIQTIKNYTVSFKQAADKLIQEFAKRTKMNRNDIAALKGELILAINHGSENAVLESKKGVDNIVREYSEIKEN